MAAGAPTSVAVEVELTAGVWTAVTTSVRGTSLEIKVGRDPGGDPQPGTCSFDLDDVDGTYTPDNPLSSLYPNLVEGKRVRVIVTKGAATSHRFLGWITVLEPQLETEPNQSITHVEAVDLLGMMARITNLPDSITAYAIGRGSASNYWPLTETNAQGRSNDLLGSGGTLTVWNKTPATGSVDFASDSSFGGGDASYAAITPGKGLWSASPAFSIPNGTTFSAALLVKPDASAFDEVMSLTAGRWASSRDRISVQTGVVGSLTYFWLNNYVLGSLSGQSPSIGVVTGAWHCIRLYDYGDGFARLVVDTEFGDSSEVTVSNSGHDTYTHVSIGGNVAQSVGSLGINVASTTPVYPAYLAVGGATGTSLPDSVTYCANLAALSGKVQQYPNTSPYPTGSILQTGGRSALDVALQLANGYAGILYHYYDASATQIVRVARRSDTRSATVALTLDAEADLAAPPTLLREIGLRAATATASSPVDSVTVTDSSVAATTGAATVDVATFLHLHVELESVASDAIAKTRDQKLRVSQVTFDLWTATNDLYAAWFATEPGDRVRVSNLPTTRLPSYIDGYVAGWTEQPMVEGYPVTLDLESAPYDEALWDTARWGWGDGVCTASALTSSGTSVTLTWTGGQLLSTSAGDYPMDIDINGERCTISSAPAGGSSPRTVTIVRGVAPTVARAHSAGDPVEVWDCARWAF